MFQHLRARLNILFSYSFKGSAKSWCGCMTATHQSHWGGGEGSCPLLLSFNYKCGNELIYTSNTLHSYNALISKAVYPII